LIYWYFTTAGFRYRRDDEVPGGQWSAHEVVIGAAGASREVKSTSKLLPDGRLRVTAEYLKDGKWVVSRGHYKESPDAKVTLK